MRYRNCHSARMDAPACLKCLSMKPTSVSIPAPDFVTFPVLSLMWAVHWSLETRLRAVVCNSDAHEFIAIYHPRIRRPTWLIRPLEDGVAMCCGTNDWAEEYVFPSLRTALLSIRRMTSAKKA